MFDQLKPLMNNGERYIVVEDGEPRYVIMRFQDYRALAAPNPALVQPASDLARVNAELDAARVREPDVMGFGVAAAPRAPDPSSVRLEDLAL